MGKSIDFDVLNEQIGKAWWRLRKKVRAFVAPEPPQAIAYNRRVAQLLVEHDSPSLLLQYRDIDEDGLVHLDDGSQLSVGFMLKLEPLLIAGLDAEAQLEAVIRAAPVENTVIQYGVLSTPQVKDFVDRWSYARTQKASTPLLQQVSKRRRDFILRTATGPSLLPSQRMHPTVFHYYLSCRVPFKGDHSDPIEMKRYLADIISMRNSVQAALGATSIVSNVCNERDIKFLLRELLNAQLDTTNRLRDQMDGVPLSIDAFDAHTKLSLDPRGYIRFSDGNDDVNCIACVPMTMDVPPKEAWLPFTGSVLGDPGSWDERIPYPFWAYTTVVVQDREKMIDAYTMKFGTLMKQTQTENAWMRSMMGHVVQRRQYLESLLNEIRDNRVPCRCYMGLNIYCPPDEARRAQEAAAGVWGRHGFRLTPEPNIGLPVMLASLPMHYSPLMDPPGRGMQRSFACHSLNASSLALVQGDWKGTGASDGGPLLISRRGQLASINLYANATNYNFVVVAESGAGKSFFANELLVDFLSKGGIARVIDVGRSYERFCAINGGENIIFNPDKPRSLNPLWGITEESQLAKVLPMLKEMILRMAFPLMKPGDVDMGPNWEYAAIEKAIISAWRNTDGRTGLVDIYNELLSMEDPRAQDVAFQLENYAIGRYSTWFNGPREVEFENPLIIIELEELKVDPELQAVILSLTMSLITQQLYLAPREIPKLLMVDEAWDLLRNPMAATFIETAFRRARKYNGCAGVITQSFKDSESSAAARAVFENAAWQFILQQKPESLEFAFKNGLIHGDEALKKRLNTVRSGPGFSEVFIKTSQPLGVYRFVTDRHTYYTYTSKAEDIARLNAYMSDGMTLVEAIDRAAMEDYRTYPGWRDYDWSLMQAA